MTYLNELSTKRDYIEHKQSDRAQIKPKYQRESLSIGGIIKVMH